MTLSEIDGLAADHWPNMGVYYATNAVIIYAAINILPSRELWIVFFASVFFLVWFWLALFSLMMAQALLLIATRRKLMLHTVRPHPHEPKMITFWDKLAHFSGKISPEKLAEQH